MKQASITMQSSLVMYCSMLLMIFASFIHTAPNRIGTCQRKCVGPQTCFDSGTICISQDFKRSLNGTNEDSDDIGLCMCHDSPEILVAHKIRSPCTSDTDCQTRFKEKGLECQKSESCKMPTGTIGFCRRANIEAIQNDAPTSDTVEC